MALVWRAGHWVGCFYCGFALLSGCQAPQPWQPAALAARSQSPAAHARTFGHEQPAATVPLTASAIQRTSARLAAVDTLAFQDEQDIIVGDRQELSLDLLVDQALAQVKEFGSDFRNFWARIERKSHVHGARTLVKRCSEDLLR